MPAALPYEEPSIVGILILASFLLLLNAVNWLLDALIYCGLVGQIFVGVAWGTPGGRFLTPEVENAVVQLGYLGLILLVFEGGLSTSFPSLRANIALSAAVAATGIAAPVGLSFILAPLAGASPVECFAAGAALCSTSLATTFAVLRASGLAGTRLGVVLSAAAMLDDVVGLVMVQVVADIGRREPGASMSVAVAVVRPLLVAVALAAAALVLCRFVVAPATAALGRSRTVASARGEVIRIDKLLRLRGTPLVAHTAILVALVAGASYAGTSNLFAAYVGGAAISWWDSEVRESQQLKGEDEHTPAGHDAVAGGPDCPDCPTSGRETFAKYYQPAVDRILQPFFFASIGFSIPITRMFSVAVVWRGIVYAILMAGGKLICGLWLVRIPGAIARFRGPWLAEPRVPAPPAPQSSDPNGSKQKQNGDSTPTSGNGVDPARPQAAIKASDGARNQDPSPPNTTPEPPKPLSLYPASILGLAMVARGKIGFLISAVAQSSGVFPGTQDPSQPDIFLIVTWAIVLCTIAGPLSVGSLVRRVRRLEGQAPENPTNGRNVLGV